MADHFGFLISQVSHIEATAYRTQYPDIQYPSLIPVDTSAHDWARTITHFSTDMTGKAEPLSNRSNIIPLADVNRAKHEVPVEMAGIGYSYSMEELNQAMMVPNLNLTADKAVAARRACEEYIDNIVLNGHTDYGWDGLINNSNVTATDAANNAAGTSRTWANKTAAEILKDINDALLGVYTGSSTVEMADTIALPPNIWTDVLTKVLTGTSVNVADYIMRANVYTMKTGQPLMIRELRGLENAAASSTGRMIAYSRRPDVLKLHLPMPHRFMPPQQVMLEFIVPGVFRLGGLEIRRPKAIRYLDGITS